MHRRAAALILAMFTAACFLAASAEQTRAQTRLEPKSYPECLLVYAKKARTSAGNVLMRRVCKCRFQANPPAECANYSKEAMDCFILNAINIEDENQVDGIQRACEKNFPLK